MKFLLAAACLAVTGIAGCSDTPPPYSGERLRAGADRQIGATGQLPPAPHPGPRDTGSRPASGIPNPVIGAIVSSQGGQKAQQAREEEERRAFDAERRRRQEALEPVAAEERGIAR